MNSVFYPGLRSFADERDALAAYRRRNADASPSTWQDVALILAEKIDELEERIFDLEAEQ